MQQLDADYYESVDINKVVCLNYGTIKGCFLGVGAIKKFKDICLDLKPSHIGFVSSKSAYYRTGAWDEIKAVLAELKIDYTMYDKVVTNPTTTSIDECVQLFKPKYDKDFMVCSIGGGSPGDAAKSIAVLLEHEGKTGAELYKGLFPIERRSKLAMVNITAGTGTECDRFAVASILENDPPLKPVIATKIIYPDYSIDDPALMVSLSPFQTRFTAIDATNHVMEAATTVITTPFSHITAVEVIYLVAKYLPVALAEPENLRARYWLAYAAAVAGMCFDEGALHITHALEHTLSAAIPDLTHGLGLSLLQPGVLRHIWPGSYKILKGIMAPLLGVIEGVPEEAELVANRLRAWHESVGVTETMETVGFKRTELKKLIAATHSCPGMDGLLSLSPVPVTDEVLEGIYDFGFFEK
eukprot:gnl/Chilomastix_caulleri/437.p1 GENE.gnl/Chilomastix_caulleri/437~~gnl/Chilomastix_caulleri/437.p1  ORF type:complete len:412 (+),score=153.06 gnl/Chilomastix_caulleri/437:95-1330(+)